MKDNRTYPNIDLIETGKHLKRLLTSRGYSVKEIQNYLQLSCPQPIYRWFKGQILPTVDHLYGLAQLLNMHMEDLLISTHSQKKILNLPLIELEFYNVEREKLARRRRIEMYGKMLIS